MKKLLAAALLLFPALFAPARAGAFENFVVNGTTYSFPDVDDVDWGQNVTDWASALTNNVIYKTGGNFFLTKPVVFGSTHGLVSAYFASTGTTLPAATTGSFRLTSGSSIAWRNEENSADLFLVLGASNVLTFNGIPLSTASPASISSLLLFMSTAGAKIAALAVDSTTAFSNLNSTGVSLSNYIAALNSTMTIVRTSTATLATRLDNVATDTTTIATNLSQRTLVISDEGGTPAATVTKLDFVGANVTYTQSNGSGTVTISGTSGAQTPRTELLTVGTSTVKGADCVVTGAASFDAMYATVGVRGLLQTSSVTANIFFQEGIYGNIGPAVIPYGTSVYGNKGSSVVWYPSGTGTMLTVHGSIDNITIDAQGRAVSSFFIKVGSSGYVGDGVKVINAQAFDQTTTGVSVFGLNNTTGAYVGATVDGHAGCVQDNLCGGLIDIQNSQSCLINLKEKNGTGSTTGKQHFYVGTSTDIVITGDYQSMGERSFVTFGGNTRLKIGGRWKIARPTNTGVFFFRNLSFQISTGTVMSADITIETAMTQPVIQMQVDAGLVIGPLVTNTYVYDYVNSTIPAQFINIPAGAFGTIVTDTHIFGLSTLCSDAGTGTNCSGNGNTINNKAAP